MIRERILRRFAGTQPRHELTDWRVLGIDAERSARLVRHFPKDPVPAAVLVPLVDRPTGMTVLLTQRASQLARHAAQIAFPGGRVDDTDADVASAALREAQEEIGLEPARVQVFGYLPDHVVISGFRVTPVEIEFWHSRLSRLHERITFRREAAGGDWVKTRLYP